MNLRGEARTKSLKNASVEFKPGENELVHHFKLKDFSSEGFGILVLKDSKVLKHIKPGNVLTMMYHSNRTQSDPVTPQTEIKHISDPESGTYQGPYVYILASHLFGAVLVVPVMEELFWRSFALRFLININFTRYALGTFTWFSYIFVSIAFGMGHHRWLPGKLFAQNVCK